MAAGMVRPRGVAQSAETCGGLSALASQRRRCPLPADSRAGLPARERAGATRASSTSLRGRWGAGQEGGLGLPQGTGFSVAEAGSLLVGLASRVCNPHRTPFNAPLSPSWNSS